MHQDLLYGHDEPLGWRDIEILPFYLGSAMLAFALVHGLAESGLALKVGGIKAMAMVGLLGLHRFWADADPR